MDTSRVAFDDLPKGPVKINDMLQAKTFAQDFMEYWVLYFNCGFDTDSPHSRKPDQSSSGYIVFLGLPIICFGDQFMNTSSSVTSSLTESEIKNPVKHRTSYQNNYLSEKYFRNEFFCFEKWKNGTEGALTLKPQVEIRTKDDNLQQLEYILSVSYTFKYGKDFKTKETCSAEKIVQIGQEVSFLDFWHCIKLNFLSLIGSLSFDIVKLQQKIYNKK